MAAVSQQAAAAFSGAATAATAAAAVMWRHARAQLLCGTMPTHARCTLTALSRAHHPAAALSSPLSSARCTPLTAASHPHSQHGRASTLEQRLERMVRQQAAIARFSTQQAAGTPAAKSATKGDSAAAATTATADKAEASRNDLAAGGTGGPSATPSNLDVLRQLMRYLWPENEPALRARVVTSLVLLLGAKVCSIYVPFMFKNAGATPQQARKISGEAMCGTVVGCDGPGRSAVIAVCASLFFSLFVLQSTCSTSPSMPPTWLRRCLWQLSSDVSWAGARGALGRIGG